jgi:ribosomal protein S12 methylthiotransferase accessory factor YcaO
VTDGDSYSEEDALPFRLGTCATHILEPSETAPKGFMVGTHRSVAPKLTVERIKPHLARMGITRVANITGLDRIGIPVVAVIRPNSRSISVSQGKGLNLDAATASALLASVESFHAERIRLPLLLGSDHDLRGSVRIMDTRDLPKSKLNLYDGREIADSHFSQVRAG